MRPAVLGTDSQHEGARCSAAHRVASRDSGTKFDTSSSDLRSTRTSRRNYESKVPLQAGCPSFTSGFSPTCKRYTNGGKCMGYSRPTMQSHHTCNDECYFFDFRIRRTDNRLAHSKCWLTGIQFLDQRAKVKKFRVCNKEIRYGICDVYIESNKRRSVHLLHSRRLDHAHALEGAA